MIRVWTNLLNLTISDTMNSTEQNNNGYERKDVNVMKVAGWGVGGAIIVVIIVVFLFQLFSVLKDQAYEDVVLKPRSADLRELRAREIEVLNSYNLLDDKEGVYRIPVERAIDIMAEEAYRQNKGEKAKGIFIR